MAETRAGSGASLKGLEGRTQEGLHFLQALMCAEAGGGISRRLLPPPVRGPHGSFSVYGHNVERGPVLSARLVLPWDHSRCRNAGSSFLSGILHPRALASAPTRQVTARYPCRGVVCCGGMSEEEPQSVTPQPEEVLTTQEAEVLQKAEAGVLPCPCCGQTLEAEMIVSADYEGVVLSCPDGGGCGFRQC